MAFRLFPPFVQFFNDSGEVLNGGSITFTNSGTTTPKATYSNKALSIENTNPVLLDSAGRPETDIWGSGSYRAVLKNALGAQVGSTFDDIEASSSLPSQTGHSGEFLTTDGVDTSWTEIAVLPSVTGQDGLYLTNNGTVASWAAVSGDGMTTVPSQDVTAIASTVIDCSLGPVVNLTHGVNITTLAFSNVPAADDAFVLTIARTKDNSGTARSITWPSSVLFGGGTDPTLTQTALARDDITLLTYDGGTTWAGSYNLNLQ